MRRPRCIHAIRFAAAAVITLVVVLAGRPGTLLQAQAPPAANQGPQTWNIQADNITPENHTWSFDSFYPGHVSAHAGDTITVSVAPNPNAFHTLALLPAGMTPQQGFPGQIGPDPDEPGTASFPFFADQSATPCGRAGQAPCTFDGHAILNSAVLIPPPPPESGINAQGNTTYSVTLASSLGPGTYYFECFVHGPSMSGSIDVLPAAVPTQSAADLKADADREYQADLNTLTNAALSTPPPTQTANADGTTTWGINAGGGAPNDRLSIDEFSTTILTIKAGDSVKWTMESGPQEVHTVTGFASTPEEVPELDAFDIACEGPGGQDTFADPMAPFPPDFWNTCPGQQESHPTQFAGPSAPSGSAYTGGPITSGILNSVDVLNLPPPPNLPPGTPPPNTSYSVTFPQPGLYVYVCTIHANMVGAVVVVPGS